METKDWITLGGILLTLGVSVYSLSINIKNRKNAIREHLYKEQIDFFVKLCKEFTELNNLIPSLFTKNEEFHKEVLKQFFEKASMIDELFESHNYIIPNDHYLLISKTMSEVYKILSIEFKKDEIFIIDITVLSWIYICRIYLLMTLTLIYLLFYSEERWRYYPHLQTRFYMLDQ